LCDALSGRCVLTPDSTDRSRLRGLLAALAEAVERYRGCLQVDAAPLELKDGMDVWMPIPGGLDLMRRLKRACDPDHVLSPGRMAGRI